LQKNLFATQQSSLQLLEQAHEATATSKGHRSNLEDISILQMMQNQGIADLRVGNSLELLVFAF
jgi:hypothetical protein